MECTEGKQIFATSGAAVITRGTHRCMDSSNHEEADTRILVHLQDALNNGTTTCLVRTVNTDVVVIIVRKLHTLLSDHPVDCFWELVKTSPISTSMKVVMLWVSINP